MISSGRSAPGSSASTLWLRASGRVSASISRRTRTGTPRSMSRRIQALCSVVMAAAGIGLWSGPKRVPPVWGVARLRVVTERTRAATAPALAAASGPRPRAPTAAP